MRMICLGIVAATLSSPSFAGTDEVSRFKAEYPEAAKRLKECFDKVRGKATIESTSDPAATKRSSSTEVVFAYERSAKLLRVRRGGKSAAGNESVYCTTEGKGFELFRDTPNASFMARRTGAEIDKINSSINHTLDRFLLAPFSIYGGALIDIMSNPKFQIISADVSREGTDELFELGYTINDSADAKADAKVTFDPKNGWIIRRVRLVPRNAPRIHIEYEVDYASTIDGCSFPKTVVLRDVDGSRTKCTFHDMTQDASPAEEFSMAHYGLPDLSDVPTKKADGRFAQFGLFGAGVIGLAAAAWLARFAKRRGNSD